MDRKTAALILFCISLPLFLLLISYQTTLFFTDLTAEQRAVFDFLQKEDKLQGYTEPELSHLEDVKRVMTFAEVVFYSLLLLTSLILTYYRREKHFIITLLRYAGITTVSLLIVLLTAVAVSFTSSFTFFHQLFFPQGNWTFPADSMLIQAFPLEFFITISRNIFLQAFLIGSLFILVSYYLSYVYRHPRP